MFHCDLIGSTDSPRLSRSMGPLDRKTNSPRGSRLPRRPSPPPRISAGMSRAFHRRDRENRGEKAKRGRRMAPFGSISASVPRESDWAFHR